MKRFACLGIPLLIASAVACGDTSDVFSVPAGATSGSASAQGGAGTGSNQGGSAAGGSSGTSSSNGGAGGNSGVPCNWGDACGSGYCDAPGCRKGTCKPLLSMSDQQSPFEPVCGCDGVSYWNASIAASRGMSVLHADACESDEQLACDANMPCPMGLYCNRQVEGSVGCALGGARGACWGVPATCPMVPKGKACFSLICSDRCSLIKGQMTWELDPFQCP